MATYTVELNPIANRHGEHAVRVRVIIDRKRTCFSLDFTVPTKDFDERTQRIKKSNLQHVLYNKKITDKLHECETTVHNKNVKRVDHLKHLIENGGNTIPTMEVSLMTAVNESEKYNTRKGFLTTVSHIKSAKLNMIPITEFNETVVEQFEKWLRSQGMSSTTVHKYIKDVRTVVNRAVRRRQIPVTENPFIFYEMPKLDTECKDPLIMEEVWKLKDVTLPIYSYDIARDVFLFCLFTGGMRISDGVSVQTSQINVVEKCIDYDMNKTGTRRVVELDENAWSIVEKYLNDNDTFLFGLLPDNFNELSEERQKKIISSKNSFVNKYLKMVADGIGITKNLHVHLARNTWGVLADENGVKLTDIQHAYGHRDSATTNGYLRRQNVRIKSSVLKKVSDAIEQNHQLKMA